MKFRQKKTTPRLWTRGYSNNAVVSTQPLHPNMTKHHHFSVITWLHFCVRIGSIFTKCSAASAEMKVKPSNPNKERCSFKGKWAICRNGCKRQSDRGLALIHAAWFRESQTAPVPGERSRRWNSSNNVSVIVFLHISKLVWMLFARGEDTNLQLNNSLWQLLQLQHGRMALAEKVFLRCEAEMKESKKQKQPV